jgi:two-component system, NarL family, sensor histidine kinase LiaS
MAASYVIVTAAAVIVVEAVVIAITIPGLLADQDLITRVRDTASTYAAAVAGASTSSSQLTLPADFVLGQPNTSLGPGEVQPQGSGLAIPQVTHADGRDAAPLSLAIVFGPDGHVITSSYPARYATGSQVFSLIPDGARSVSTGYGGLISPASTGNVAWAVEPVFLGIQNITKSDLAGKGGKGESAAGYVYVQAPVQPRTIASVTSAEPLLQPGLVVLLLAVPVGTLFGLLTTRGVVRRLRRLADTSAGFAEGDFAQRVSPGPADEVGRLERNFNEMAERLSVAVSRERSLAEKSARLAERSRISRELHDSISQDLFSLSLLAGGLEKALPDDSPVRNELRTLSETVQSANREMRALLLELRPTTLDEKGLLAALTELAATYAQRLAMRVDADLDPVSLSPAAELAALRIAQEGLANAIKHAHATSIGLAMHRRGDFAEITISDDGQGFVNGANGGTQGLGLRLMRERVDELGGTLTVVSRPREGTVVTARLPVSPP